MASLQAIIVAGEKLKFNNASIDFFKRYHRFDYTTTMALQKRMWSRVHIRQHSEFMAFGSIIGKPIDNTHIYILDKSGRPVPPLITGELWIAGIGAQGYLNRSTSDKALWTHPTFFLHVKTALHNTGDLAYWSNEGDLHYVGRCDEQIKISGHRVELSEIEIQCGRYSGIEHVAVIATKAKEGRQQLIAYLVPQSGESLSADEIRHFLHGFLPKHMIPTYFITVSELPLTANGKVDKRRLTEMYPESSTVLPNKVKVFVKPTSILEKQVSKLWADILAISYEQLSVLDSFSDLGGEFISGITIHQFYKRSLWRTT